MGFAEEFNALDYNRFLILFGALLIIIGVATVGLVPGQQSFGVEVAVAGLGMVTLGKAGNNGKKMEATLNTLKQVVLCGKPPNEPACKYEMKAEVAEVLSAGKSDKPGA